MAAIAGLDGRGLINLTGNPTGTGGAINESMMQSIWDVSRIPLPFMDRVGSGKVDAIFYDWLTDKLATADGANKWVDTANFSLTTAGTILDYANSATAPTAKYRNHIQTMVKGISVSEVAQSVSSVGGAGGLSYNLIVAQKEIKRDMEARCVGNYASVASIAATTAGETASYIGGCKDQATPTRDLVDTSGTEGGYNTSTFVFAVLTAGTKRAITETKVRNLAQALYTGGCGGPEQNLVGMAAPTIKRTISSYFYTSTAKIASLLKDVGSAAQATAQGSVEYFITDFGTVELVPNRFMGDLGTNQYGFFLFDPAYFELVYLRNVNVTENAKIGLVDRRTVSCSFGTRFNPECMGLIADIDDAAAMTA